MLPNHIGPPFEWDPKKRVLNLERHGLDFEDVADLDWDHSVTAYSPRGNESRWITFLGHPDKAPEIMYAVVYTIREERTRVISFRRANQNELRNHAVTD